MVRAVPKANAFETVLKSDFEEGRWRMPEDRMRRHMVRKMGFAGREDDALAGQRLVGFPIRTEKGQIRACFGANLIKLTLPNPEQVPPSKFHGYEQ
jgi:hypothetical protein